MMRLNNWLVNMNKTCTRIANSTMEQHAVAPWRSLAHDVPHVHLARQ